MLEIEEQLKNDPTGAYKQEVISKFHELSEQARQEINKGLMPEEYEQITSLLQALEAGIKVVEQY